MALLGSPAVLVLDEPCCGCDPPSRAAIHTALRRQAAAGAALLVTLHDVAEAEQVGGTTANCSFVIMSSYCRMLLMVPHV